MIEYICYITFANGKTVDLSHLCNKSNNSNNVVITQIEDRQHKFIELYKQLSTNYAVEDRLLDKLNNQQSLLLHDSRRACAASTPSLREYLYKQRVLEIIKNYTGNKRVFELVYNYVVYTAATKTVC